VIVITSTDELLMRSLGGTLRNGVWKLWKLPDAVKQQLGDSVQGCNYLLNGDWYSDLYAMSLDPRCQCSYNTLVKRAAQGYIDFTGRARPRNPFRRAGQPLIVDGKTYTTISAFARAYEIRPELARARLRLGWSFEEIVKGKRDDG
jgi:hypothetical protein